MKEPCRSCEEKDKDFGGCHCQAFLLTGDATNTDPVCHLSPQHNLVTEAVDLANLNNKQPSEKPLVFRNSKNSKPFK